MPNDETVDNEETIGSENTDETLDEDEVTLEDDQEDTDSDEAEQEAKRQRKATQVERLKAELAETKAKLKEKESATPSDEIILARLEVRGVTNSEDQAEVMKYAKLEGISPIEALDDPFLKARLEQKKSQREARQASPERNNRTGTSPKSVEYYINRGEMPKDKDMAAKVRERLAEIARESA